IPVAFISTRTSPAFGPSRSTSMISRGFLASNATAARVFILNSTFAFQAAAGTWSDQPFAPADWSSLAHAGILRLGVGLRLVFLLGGARTPDGVIGAGTQIDVKVVHVAGDVRIIAKRRHDGVAVLAAACDYADEVAVIHGLD